MQSSTDPEYLQPYKLALKTHGDSFHALLWANISSQRTRFQAIQDAQPMNGRTVLDVGCGRADLLDFLVSKGLSPSHYVGVEAMSEFAVQAEKKVREGVMIVRGDFLAEPIKMFVGAEIVVFSGSLNTLSREEFFKTIGRAYDATAEVLVFNFLSSPRLAGNDYLTWHFPGDVLKFCRTLCEDVALDEGYIDGDATIRMRKPEHA